MGTEKQSARNSGEDITTLTALARVGVDPWHEAARLAELPRGEAAHSLAATFANLPDTCWAAGDAADAAQRMVDKLPQPRPHKPAPLGAWIFLTWRFWTAVGLVVALIALNAVSNFVGPLT